MKIKNYLLLLTLGCLWGPSFLLMKIGVQESSPLSVSTFRIAIGALILILILKIRRTEIFDQKNLLLPFAIGGFFNMALPFTLISWAEQYIDSALAGMLNGLTPIFTLIFTHYLNKEEKLTTSKIIGASMGLIGLCVLLLPYLSSGNLGSTLGISLVVIAASSYSFGTIYTKKKLIGLKPLVAPASQLLMATIMLTPIYLSIGNPSGLISVPTSFWLAVAALGFFGAALAYIVFFEILKSADASFLSMVTYLVPIISVILGVIVLNEKLFWNTYLGAFLIFSGIAFTNFRISNPKIMR